MEFDFKNYLEQARMAKAIPMWSDLLVDAETPISIFNRLSPSGPGYLLESVDGGETLGRFSFIGFDPLMTFTSKDGRARVVASGKEKTMVGNPLKLLEEVLEDYRVLPQPGLPRFFGGAVGYIGYDVVRFLEKLPVDTHDDLQMPDCYLVLTRVVLVYDHVGRRVKIVVLSMPGDDPEGAFKRDAALLDSIKKQLLDVQGSPELKPLRLKPGATIPYSSTCSRQEYMQAVEKAKEYIRAGDIFQVVPSQRLKTTVKCDPFDVYRILRSINPSPYLFYLNFEGVQLVGSSPEMLVRVEDGQIETRPIAGTRPRGSNPKEDLDLAEELLNNEKERAEHLMLVDLGRNDIGRVSQAGTVRLPKFMEVERYSHVMHLVTSVQGTLREDKTPIDALAACFPAGTLSGAPKVRAMEIIEELESFRRGPYGGAVGYFGLTGNIDTCITIRTIVFQGNHAFVQAGGGVVADSDPEMEFEETLNKARALLSALAQAEEDETLDLDDRQL